MQETSFSLEDFQNKLNGILKDNLSVFQGLIISGISMSQQLNYQKTYYQTTSLTQDKKDQRIQIMINNGVLKSHFDTNSNCTGNAKFDITIDKVFTSRNSEIIIIAKAIKETGVSTRELLHRRLEKYCLERGYNTRIKKELPCFIVSIFAITSKGSIIRDDLLSNLNIANKDDITIVHCETSKEISLNIKRASQEQYNIVVLFRGGTEDQAMSIFSSECIIDAIVESSIPVCAALGHEMDAPFIYKVVDKQYSTPSAFSKDISIHNAEKASKRTIPIKEIIKNLKLIENKLMTKSVMNGELVSSLTQHFIKSKTNILNSTSNNCEKSILNIHNKTQAHVKATIDFIRVNLSSINKEIFAGVSKNEVLIISRLEKINTRFTGNIELARSNMQNNIDSIVKTKKNIIYPSDAEVINSIEKIVSRLNQSTELASSSIQSNINSVAKTKKAIIDFLDTGIGNSVDKMEGLFMMRKTHKSSQRKLLIIVVIIVAIAIVALLQII
ncbi:MAG: exodeoxyribonuclease VII large subunit [Sulfurimonas sp.]|jgi:exonuclease VII large subunit